MQGTKKTSAGATAGALIAALLLLSLAGCATTGSGSSKTLMGSEVDPSAFGSRSSTRWRLQTYGPDVRQLYGYVLYPDGVTVSASGRIHRTPLGKMSLADVQQDYQRVMKENMLQAGGNLILREVLRNGSVRHFHRNDAMDECHHLGYGARHPGPGRPAGDIPVIRTLPFPPSKKGDRGGFNKANVSPPLGRGPLKK